MARDTAPTGAARRRRRLSDAETEQRMLRTALAMVHRSGLTVSLDHISLEDVIGRAGVARSAVYRRWPYKDMFFSDLLKQLARGASPAILGENAEAVESLRHALLDRLDWLATPALRYALAGEVLRRSALAEFETFHASAEWRTYFALHATFLGLPDGELRSAIQDALTGSERALIGRVAEAYRRVTDLLGLRLRADTDATFETMASLLSAVIRGLVLMAPANPAVGDERVRANPFGAPEPAEWSQPALGMAGVIATFVEPDDSGEWSADRIDAARRTLSSATWLTDRRAGPVDRPAAT